MTTDLNDLRVSSSVNSNRTFYETLNQYQMISVFENTYPDNYVFSAYKDNDPNNIWYLALRHGEFSAQVEKAVNNIFKTYIPSTPDATIVHDPIHHEFYIASQSIADLITPYGNIDHGALPIDFGNISVLSHFVGESNFHQDSILVSSSHPQSVNGHKIDHKVSLSPEYLQSDTPLILEDILDNPWSFPENIIQNQNYKTEQLNMLKTIAQTPFEDIAAIIQTITASHKEEYVDFMKKMTNSTFIADEDRKNIQYALQSPNLENKLKEVLEVDDILILLKSRHQQYQQIEHQLQEPPTVANTMLSMLPEVHQPVACE